MRVRSRFFTTLLALGALLTPALAAYAVEAPAMSPEELTKGKQIYFERCAGCHGTLRKGATGPNLLPDKMREMGSEVIGVFIGEGTAGGMPAWGPSGTAIFTDDEVNLMARYIQQDVSAPPEISLGDMTETWKLTVPVNKRPKKPAHTRNWQNFFGVILRDAGKVAIIDGDTKEKLAELPTGFAVHILRSSESGRYFYVIGRDGKATLIDLWSKTPTIVAEVKPCAEARSIDGSKYKGFEDKLAIVGCYWPPQFAVLDGQTLEPKKVVSTRSMTWDTGEYHPEPRVAAIVASHYKPEWVLNIKETGFIWLVDYSDLKNLNITMLEGERFLHDGGWDATHRYFMAAANMKDTEVVVDTKMRKVVAKFKVGVKPHPGRGANWDDPKYGPVSSTCHLGEGKLSVWGSDPEKHAQHAWKVVHTIALPPGAGSLFVKTHPKSGHVWVDFTLNSDAKATQTLCVLDKANIEGTPNCFQVTDHGRVVHQEYNKEGNEVWISVWDKGDKGEIVIYDDKTLKVKTKITGLQTPTGKFNVYNSRNDLY
ncbi:MAG: c-type cytochrome [Nitrospinae bacterium]|nr:c-type cytochrome [Nitrospinota bacterium]